MALVVVMATFGLAVATHPGASSAYSLIGFSADSKTVYFKKASWNVMQAEEWFVVWDATTGKQKTSQPILRHCGAGGEFEAGAECEGPRGSTVPQIEKKTGERTVAKLHASHGAVAKDPLLVPQAKIGDDQYLKAATSTGHTQVFTGKGIEIKVTTTYEGKKLPDLSDGTPKTAFFKLAATITAGGETWTASSRVYGEPVEDLDNGNIIRWEGLYVQYLALAPDRHAFALTFAGKPFLIQRKK